MKSKDGQQKRLWKTQFKSKPYAFHYLIFVKQVSIVSSLLIWIDVDSSLAQFAIFCLLLHNYQRLGQILHHFLGSSLEIMKTCLHRTFAFVLWDTHPFSIMEVLSRKLACETLAGISVGSSLRTNPHHIMPYFLRQISPSFNYISSY